MKKILIFLTILCLNFNLNASTPQDFPYPIIPDSLKTPQDRASYLVEHFWDNFNFSDTVKTGETKIMEQYFVDFISLFSHSKKDAVENGVKNAMKLTSNNIKCYTLFAELAEKYFYQKSSPLVNESYFRIFLNNIITTPIFDETNKMRYQYLYERTEKNKIGEPATDIYFYHNRKSVNLLSIEGESILLLFYDYNCKECKDLIESLKTNTKIKSLVDKNSLKIVAICTNVSLPEWIRYKQFIPQEWINGYDINNVVASQEYYVTQQLPAMFLIRDKKLILKEPSLQVLVEKLN